jgi:hypothetical protein
VRFKSWLQKSDPVLFAAIGRSTNKCMPKQALLPEHYAAHLDSCPKHASGAGDLVRIAGSRWLSSDPTPVFYPRFGDFCRMRANAGAYLHWLTHVNHPKWKKLMAEASARKIPLGIMQEIAEIWREWGHGDEPDLTHYGVAEFVYVLVAPEVNRIKIGFSTCPDRRFDTIRNVGPCPIVVLALMPGSMLEEKALHSLFLEERLPGTEWFSASLRVMRFARMARNAKSARQLLRDWLASDSNGGVFDLIAGDAAE